MVITLLILILGMGLWIAYRQEVIHMATKADFDALLAAVDAETTRIANKIQELIDRLGQGGLTVEEEAAVLTELSAASARLRTIGADPADPVPVE